MLSANGGPQRRLDRPENAPPVREETAGSDASFAAGEINRLLTTQLPAAATAAACQLQLHASPGRRTTPHRHRHMSSIYTLSSLTNRKQSLINRGHKESLLSQIHNFESAVA